MEIYTTSNTFPAQWAGSYIEVYSAPNTKTTYVFDNSTATACTISNKTWITYNVTSGLRQQNALVILRDKFGDTIDAFVFDNTNPPAPWKSATDNWAPSLTTGCPAIDTALNTQAGLAGTTPKQANMLVVSNYGNKDMARTPDGGTPWDLTSNTGAGTTYTQCVTNNANFSKSVDNATPTPGSTVTFTLSVANMSNSSLTGVVVDDYLPNYAVSGAPTYISAIPVNPLDGVDTSMTYATTDPNTGTSGNAKKIVWTPASIAAGTTAKLNIKMQVPTNATPGYTYTNTAQTTAGLTSNQTDFANITVGSLNVGSFVITASPASASTCSPALLGPKLTITAMTGPNGTGSVNTSYGGSASVYLFSSSPNVKWYNSAGSLTSVSPVPASSFVNGVATFYLTNATAETITVSALDVVTYAPDAMQGSSGNITFTSGSGGLALTDADTLSPPYGAVAGRPHKIRATISSCGSTATSRTGSYSGTVRYTAGLNHPTGASAPTLSTTASCPGTVGPLSTSSTTALTLTFTEGVSDFYLCTSDVGQFALNMTLNLTSPTASVSSVSSNFTIRPFAITATGLTAGPIAAGSSFSATFNAWNWHSAYDTDSNGMPDTGVTALNFIATNSGKALRFDGTTNNAGVINFAAAFGAGGTGTLNTITPTTATASSATVTLNNLSYPDVGYITLAGPAGYANYGATNYLGLSLLHVPLLSESRWFVPAYLETEVEPACSSFTYSGQAFKKVTIKAKNTAGNLTNNYTASGAAKAVTLTAVGASGTISNSSVAASNFTSAGTAILTTPAFSFTSLTSSPTSLLRVRATDADGVNSDGHEGATGEIRIGRVSLSSAYGSERLPLSMPIVMQFYNGSYWQTNTDDSCTQFFTAATGTSTAAYSPPATSNTTNACYGVCSDASTVKTTDNPVDYAGTVLLGGATGTMTATASTPTYPAATPDSTTFVSGQLVLTMGAPLVSGTYRNGSLDLTLAVPPWLQFNGANPKAKVNFGLYNQQGNAKKIIYRREVR